MNVRPVAWPASAQRPNAWELLQSHVEEVVPGVLVSLIGIGLLVYGCAGRDSLRPPPPPEPVLAVAPPPEPEPEPEVVARVERALLKPMPTQARRGPPRRPPPPAPPAPLALARAAPPLPAPATIVAPPPQIAARPAQPRSEPPPPPEAPAAPALAIDAPRPPVAAAAVIPAPVSLPAPPVTTAAPEPPPVVSATAPAITAKPKAPIPPPPPPSPARSVPVSTPARVIAAKPPPPPPAPASISAPAAMKPPPPPPPALSAPAPVIIETSPPAPLPPATVAAPAPTPQPAEPAKRIDRKKRPTPMTAQDATHHLTAAWEEATGEPATLQVISVLWAQWALETGRGRWMVDYNYAGLKGRAPDGGAANWWTWEETDKGTRRIRARFRSYETASEGALDYVQLLLRLYPRAVKAAREGNASAFVLELEQGGFFTDCPKHYVPSVTSLALEFRRQHRAARF